MYVNGPDGLDQQVVRMHDLGGVHPPDPLHLVAGFQRFRNALSICHLFYQPNPQKQGAGILCCIFCWIGRLCFLEF